MPGPRESASLVTLRAAPPLPQASKSPDVILAPRLDVGDLTRAHFVDAPRRRYKGPANPPPGPIQRPDLEALVAHYKGLLRLENWRIAIRYVPDLARAAGPVWGLCVADAERAEASILIRDPETPPPGSTVAEAVAEVAKTVVHELIHCRLEGVESSPALNEQATHALEAALCAARGTALEQQFARALRARTAPARAKGTPMSMNLDTVKKLVDAIEAGDAAAMLEIGKQLLVEAASGAAAGAPPTEDPAPPSTPDPGDSPPMEKPVIPPQPGADPGMARARAVLATEVEHARSARRSITTDAIYVKIQRARDVDGIALAAEDERDLLACDTTDAAEKLLGVMKRHAAPVRARSGANPGAKARTAGDGGDPAAEVESAHEVKIESLVGREATTYQQAKARGAAHAKAALDGIKSARKSRGVSIATGVKS